MAKKGAQERRGVTVLDRTDISLINGNILVEINPEEYMSLPQGLLLGDAESFLEQHRFYEAAGHSIRHGKVVTLPREMTVKNNDFTTAVRVKVGDMVLVSLPESVTKSPSEVGKLNGKVLPISRAFDLGGGSATYLVEECLLLEKHLERAKSPAPDEACTEQEPQQSCKKLDIKLVGLEKKELPNIDWEQRRWEFYKEILIQHPNYDPPVAIKLADSFIERYKQTLK